MKLLHISKQKFKKIRWILHILKIKAYIYSVLNAAADLDHFAG